MISALTNHLWQSTLFAIATALLTLVFRNNHAKVRYWLWLSASLKFFVPFSLLISFASQLEWAPAARKVATQVAGPAISFTVEQFSEPFAQAVTPTRSMAGHIDWFPVGIIAVWVCGFLAIALIRSRASLRIRYAIRASRPATILAPVEVRLSRGLIEPGVVGLFHSILLLPEGIMERLTPSQLEAVLAHELCHIRRRDNLWASIHMMVEALFWFHPLVWWIGARLVEERERACDEEVLRLGNQASVYADAILHVCKLYLESPLACVSGVAGSDIRRRIEVIMSNRGLQGLNRAQKFLLAGAGLASVVIPVVIGILVSLSHVPVVRAQTPKFDIVSIKPCSADSLPPGARSGPVNVSAGRMVLNCMTTLSFVARAFVDYTNGQSQGAAANRRLPIEGLPAWTNSEHYTIEAATQDTFDRSTMFGPMLQAVLEDRFRLKAHRETREVPVYEMTVVKGGLKVKRSQEGSCTPRDPNQDAKKHPDAGQKPFCGQSGIKMHGQNQVAELRSMTMEDFAHWITIELDRVAVDNTGVTGKFDFDVEYAPRRNTDSPDAGPSVFTALPQQLGLKLSPAKGPGQFLVIDRIERPSEN
jgi:uncharacterized protein (TIGR03435 family)